ncbi:MAG: DUF2339 domain-containing protein [bacterium]
MTVLAFWQAIKFDSLAVSALGWAGGYLTPFLLSTGQANEIGLFTYIVLLEAGLLAILLKKEKWVVLELLTVLATYAVFFAWFIEYYDENELLLPMFFLSLFWAIFYAFDIIQHLRSVSLHRPLRIISAAGNAAFYYACVYILLYPKYFDQAGAVTLGIGLVYFLTVFILKNKIANAWAVLSQYTVTAIALLVFATAIQFSGFTIITLWSLEALLLVLCSVRWPLAYVRNAALVLFVVAAIALLNMRSALAYQPIEDFSLIFNARFLAFATLGLALGTSAYVLRQKESAGTPQMITLLQIGCCLVFLVLFTVETLDIFEKAIFRLRQQALSTGASNAINQLKNLQQLTLSGVWLFYSIILMAGGLWSRIQGLRFAAIALFGISILKVFIYDLSYLDTLYRIFSFIGLGVILLGVSYLYQRYKILLFEK